MLKISYVSFPFLGIDNLKLDSVAFSIGSFDIAWYALIILTGMICAVVYTMLRAKKIGVTTENIMDCALFTIPIAIIGARLYYVIMDAMKNGGYSSFWDIINIRDGGLGLYGGVIAGTTTVLVYCKVKKIRAMALVDCGAPGLILAQSIGRWGNFMNGEAHGGVTDIFCRMGLDGVYVHPTFLYESLWNLLGFILINIFYKHKKYDGQIFLMVFGWYGFGRMLIEGLRTDSLYLGPFRVSQVLGGLIFLVSLGFLIYFAFKRPYKDFFYYQANDLKTTKNKKKKDK